MMEHVINISIILGCIIAALGLIFLIIFTLILIADTLEIGKNKLKQKSILKPVKKNDK